MSPKISKTDGKVGVDSPADEWPQRSLHYAMLVVFIAIWLTPPASLSGDQSSTWIPILLRYLIMAVSAIVGYRTKPPNFGGIRL